MINDYGAVGGIEAWNTGRLAAYLENVGSPFATGPTVCQCDALTPTVLELGFTEYQTPALDPAPWFDPDFPTTSSAYLGFLPLSITGVDDNPRARTVTNAVGGGGVFGPVRDQPRTITVTGAIIGTSCCGAEYGLHFLSEVLSGCTGETCDGDCLTMFDCCPPPGMTPAAFNAAHRRTFRRTALVSGPTVVRRDGTGSCVSGNCAGGGDVITVEFVLVAANPWAWTDIRPLLDVDLPTVEDEPCIDWCVLDPVTLTGDCDASECLFGDCAAAVDCGDPLQAIPAPPQPTAPQATFCAPIGTARDCYSIDLTFRPEYSTDVPVITVSAGSSDLRNVRLLLFAKPADSPLNCDAYADANRCNAIGEFVITYLQAGGVLTIDGQTNTSTTVCNDICVSATTVFGDQDGGPVKYPEMGCALYCFCIESDPENPPASDSEVSLGVSGRGL